MNNLARRTFLFQCINPKLKKVSRSHLNKLISIRQYSSAQSGLQESSYEFEIRNMGPRNLKKRPPIRPFLKDIFSSTFNKDLLAFPEVLDNAALEDLAHRVGILDKIVSEKVTSDELLKTLKNTRVLAMPATYSQGGFEAILTERCKLLETLSKNVEAARYIKNHWLGTTSVKSGLAEEHLDAVMFDLTTGKHSIALCIQEAVPDSPNKADLSCKASCNIENEWTITGTKMCKSNENGYFIVACSVDHEPVQMFLIHPNASGTTINPSDSTVSFRNTPGIHLGSDPDDDPMSQLSEIPFMKDVIAMSRLEVAAIVAGVLRNTIEDTVLALRGKYTSGIPAGENQLIQRAITNAVSKLYAIESMVYFTAGLYDGYENSDIEVEACVCQYYATHNAFDSINQLINAVGMNIFSKDILKYSRDAQSLLLDEEQTDSLVVYAGMSALKHTANKYAEDVKKVRNPFFNPAFILKKMLKDRKQSNNDPDLNLYLEENLHPSLQFTAKSLEYCVLRMGYATEHVFVKHGRNVVNEHRFLKRLVDMASEIYAVTTSVSRASRAYCIGLHMSENELLLTNTLTVFAEKKIRDIILEIEDGVYLNQDSPIEDIATKTVAHGKSHLEHCLERVYF